MEVFSFYADLIGTTLLAVDCRYVYKGAEGDPLLDPTQSKTSIWVLFEFASGDGDCKIFYYVIIRAPHGDPIHCLQELPIATGDGRYGKLMTTLARMNWLMLDDWGLAPFSDAQRRGVLER
jgi:hypothetical protein